MDREKLEKLDAENILQNRAPMITYFEHGLVHKFERKNFIPGGL